MQETAPASEPASEPTGETEADRRSRQELVLPPRTSSLPLVFGALVCCGTGFGLVWALGVGRSNGLLPAAIQAASAAASASTDPDIAADRSPTPPFAPESMPPADGPREPSRFPTTDGDVDAPRAMTESGWRPPNPVSAPQPLDRYPTRPATLETPLPPAADGAHSRFAPPGRFPGTGDTPVRLASVEAGSVTTDPAPLPDALAPEPPAPSGEVPMPAPTDSGRQASDRVASDDEERLDGDETPPAPAAAAVDPPALPGPPLPSATAADLAPPPPASFRPAVTAPVPPSPVPPAPSAAGVPTPSISTVAANPFAVAPPMGPPTPRAGVAMFDPRGPLPSGPAVGPAPPAVAGQGRPGAAQLEGLQTPQLAVEKRGPREIQVGKPARYEILVRNVGTAIAQDVTLRDAVPYGTTLITTTPPASPAGAAAAANDPTDLLWPLGTLAPGAEARVSMEVMPQIEGEIGSVASVSFRTEASARSRATKPALHLEASEAKPVRIGGELKLSLKVSNPGTGITTGIVIEGALPEGVSHGAGRELEFDVGQLRPGESRTIDLVMGSTGPGVHTASFTARADGRLEISQPVRLEVTAPTLELSAQMPSRRYLQRPATCVLSMVNAGTAAARSIELAAQLPPGMKFVRANNAGWYEERTHRVLWNLEELPPGEVGTVEMVLMPVDLGPQRIVAAARSSDGPSDQKIHTVEVEGLAALFFEVTDSEDPIEVGGMTEYIIRIGNQGTKAAGGVRLTATLLGDLEPLDAKGPVAHRIDNLAFIFEPLAKLAPAEEAVFRVRVRGRREGDQRMQVQLISDDHPAPITKEEITRVYADN